MSVCGGRESRREGLADVMSYWIQCILLYEHRLQVHEHIIRGGLVLSYSLKLSCAIHSTHILCYHATQIWRLTASLTFFMISRSIELHLIYTTVDWTLRINRTFSRMLQQCWHVHMPNRFRQSRGAVMNFRCSYNIHLLPQRPPWRCRDFNDLDL